MYPTVPQEDLNSKFESGKITQAIEHLTRQFERFEHNVNEKFDKIDERLRRMSDAHPTRREFDDLKDKVDDLSQSTGMTDKEIAKALGQAQTWNMILKIAISVVVVAALGYIGIHVPA